VSTPYEKLPTITAITDIIDTLRFRFELRPLAEIHPWGTDRPTLHWFGLTDGWYWIQVGGHELLRYSDQTVHSWTAEGYNGLPYVDYYVVRLWEDLLRSLPAILEPVPEDLTAFIESDAAIWTPPADDIDAYTAQVWHDQHSLDLGYLRDATRIRWWRTIRGRRDSISIDWRNRRSKADRQATFAGPAIGRRAIPTDAFVDAVVDLDRNLMAAMEQRVAELEQRGTQPGIYIDLVALRQEQYDRANWLSAAMDRNEPTDWEAVRSGAARIQRSQP
jgi:hypothetical protein